MKIEVVWLVIKFVALIFTSFELFSIITNKNKKMSIAGTIVLAFSGCVMWNLDKIDSLILGQIITVLFYIHHSELSIYLNIRFVLVCILSFVRISIVLIIFEYLLVRIFYQYVSVLNQELAQINHLI